MSLEASRIPTSSSTKNLKKVSVKSWEKTQQRRTLSVKAVSTPQKEDSAESPEPNVGGLNKVSSKITQPRSQGASQAMLYGVGLSDEDMNKPQVH